MGSISPCNIRFAKLHWTPKFPSKNGLSGPQNWRIALKKKISEKWAAFPPVLITPSGKIKYSIFLSQIFWNKRWNRLSGTPKIEESHWRIFFFAKNGQHFPLFDNPKWQNETFHFSESNFLRKMGAFCPLIPKTKNRIAAKSWGGKKGSISPCFPRKTSPKKVLANAPVLEALTHG